MVEAASRRTARERARGDALSSTRQGGRPAAAAPGRAAPPPQDPQESGARSTAPKRRTPARMWNSFLRNRSVRVRVLTLLAVPLLAASLLGGLLLGRAVQDAFRAQRAADLATLAQTALDASQAVQDERDATALNGVSLTSGIEDVRAETDAVVRDLTTTIGNTSTTGLPESTKAAIRTVDRRFGELETVRQDQDYQQTPFDTGGVQGYVAPVRAVTDLVSQLSIVDPRLAVEVEGLTTLSEAAEQASTERGLTAWVLQRGELPTPEQKQTLGALQGGQDNLLDRVYDRLPSGPLAEFRDGLAVVRGPISSARLTVAQASAPGELTAEDWFRAATDRLDVMRGTQAALMDEIVDASNSRADSARLTAILTLAGLVLVLVVAVVLTLAVARSIVRPLRTLQAAALRTAKKDLPELVERVHEEGPKAVQSADSGLRAEGNDEIGRVATAFDEVFKTAVRVTGEQALLRQNLDSIVVNLSRRTQSLVDRQLREIETLEGSERDPDQLATLFRIDHLATRVQRHAESLLVLAGVDSSTKSPEAVPLLDVVRAAAGEVEQYERVRFGVLPTDLIAARAVDDVAHLVAELLDNATEFSPPATTVLVDSQRLVGGSLRITVTDQGLGVPAARLAELNERLGSPGEIDVAASRTLGLYVVARLAGRHGITVKLEAQSSGGTVARIDIPASIVDAGAPADAPEVPALVGAGATPSWNVTQQGGWTPSMADSGDLPRRGAAERRAELPGRPAGPARPGDDRPAGRPESPIRERRVVDRPSGGDPRPQQRGDNGVAPRENGLPQRSENGLPQRGDTGLPQRGDGGIPQRGDSGIPQRGENGPPQRGAPLPQRGGGLPQRGAPGTAGPPAGAGADRPAPGAPGGPAPDRRVPERVGASAPSDDPLTDPGLRASAQPAGSGEQESPIYSALRSSWFRRASADPAGEAAAWSSPADDGWRQAAAATRFTESMAALPRNGTAPAPERRRPAPASARQDDLGPAGRGTARTEDSGAAAPLVGTVPTGDDGGDRSGAGRSDTDRGTDAPAGPVPSERTNAGLPLRQRGASLVPGAIAAPRGSEVPRDAQSVRSTLSTLVTGVARGRDTARVEDRDDTGDGDDTGSGPGSNELLARPDERNDQ